MEVFVTQLRDGKPLGGVDRISMFVERAVELLVNSELRFCGNIVEASAIKVVVETPILGKLDRTEFEGTPDAMKSLVAIAYLWLKTVGEHREEIVDVSLKQIEDGLGELSGIPAYLAIATPYVMGNVVLNSMMQNARELQGPQADGA